MTEHTNVEVQDNEALSRFEALDTAGAVAGHVEYERRYDGTVVLTHTEVQPAYEGKGVGSSLARGTLDLLRARGAAVDVKCEFLAGYVRKHPEYEDLLSGR
ncbi:MAG TPA: GNAT family N-acetyltransferase [Nocardioidaceae bacterium]|jgi:predicted GNAT family acetyltransferase